ncbi:MULTISPECIES: phage/plasmid primase, P4 family [unclassified Glutamicibacter]|uniref:phage/plasmid primase, P4 family n=1 Tax=unclassified Glutamicibacter TaxID=2627139 RepID=UPI0037FA2FA0
MSIISRDDDQDNEPDDVVPVFADDVAEGPARVANPVADAYTSAVEHFSSDGEIAPQNEVVRVCTSKYLDAIDRNDPPAPGEIEKELLAFVNGVSKIESMKTTVAIEKLPLLKALLPVQVAMVVDRLYRVAEVTPGGTQQDDGLGILSIYKDSGDFVGLYRRVDLGLLDDLARQYNFVHDGKWLAEFERALRGFARKVPENQNTDLVVMGNLIYDYRNDERIPFSPDYVFLARHSETDLIERQHPDSAITIVREDGKTWNYDEWWVDTVPDEGTRSYIQHVIGAAFRPAHDWQKMPCLFSETGSNGKGTILAHIRAMIGSRNCRSVPLKRYGSQFGKSQLIGARLNIPDETPVGEFIKDATDLKSIITNDPIEIDRKHKDPITYKPTLLTILTLNGELNFRDKTKSMDRRIAIVPMTQRFDDGVKIKAIKDDYLQRREVCEYMAYKVLVEMPKFWELEEPSSVKQALKEHKVRTNTVLAFFEEYKDEFVRPFVPFPMVRALYVAWLKENRGSSNPVEAQQFTKEAKECFDADSWVVPQASDGSDRKLTTRNWLTEREPVLDEFHYVDDVNKWQYEAERGRFGGDALAKSAPRQVRGFMRRDVYEVWMAAGGASGPDPAAKAVCIAKQQRTRAAIEQAEADDDHTVDPIGDAA